MRSLIGVFAGALVLAAVGCGGDAGGTSSAGGGEGGGAAGTGGAGGTSSASGTGGGSASVTFAQVYDEVFKPNACTSASCHYGSGFDLSDPAKAHAQLVGATASGACGEFVRVVPGDPSKSLVYLKVTMTKPPCGAQMPLNTKALDAAQIALLEAWIEAGAPE